LFCAAIAIYHRLVNLAEIYWLTVLEAGKFNTKASASLVVLIPRWCLEHFVLWKREAHCFHRWKRKQAKEGG
jgi:hypothetical protein